MRVECYACFRSVRDYESHLGILGKGEIVVEIPVRIYAPVDYIYHFDGVDGLALVYSLEVEVIQTVLGIDHVHHSLVDRLHEDHASVEVCLLVGLPYYPVHECPEEIAFPELDDFLRVTVGMCRFSVQCFHI